MENTKRGNPITRWFRETKNELKKVVWPNFTKVKQNTLIVLLYILIVGAVIWALDLLVFLPLLRLIGAGS